MRNYRGGRSRRGLKNVTTREGRYLLHTRRETLVNRYWYYLTLLLIIVGLVIRQPLLTVIGILLLLVLITTDIWANFCLDKVTYQRILSQERMLFGEEVTLSISVENAKLLPLPWLEVEDIIPQALMIQGQHHLPHKMIGSMMLLECLFSPRWYERVTRRYTIRCSVRGLHAFGPTKLRSGDIFGFINRDTTIENKQFLLVYPLILPLERFSLPARHPFGDQRAPRHLIEDPMRAVGVRDYAYGDSMRRVNWKATARTTKLQSHVYEATTTYTIALFLNIATRLDKYYGVHPELQELAICAAASVTDWALNEGYSMGLYANTIMTMPDEEISGEQVSELEPAQTLSSRIQEQLKRRRIRVPPSSNQEQRQRIMEALARIRSHLGDPIEDVLYSERSRLPAGATIILVTSTITDALLDILKRIRQNGHTISILFVGDAPPQLRLPGMTIHHIGGEATWQRIVASYRADQLTSIPGFSL